MTQRPVCLPALYAMLLAAASLVAMTAAATADEPTVLSGRVLLPDGKPAAGVGIYWVQFKAQPPRKPGDAVFEKHAVTNDEGRFELTFIDQDAPLDDQLRPLIAYKPGYGIDWTEITQDQASQEVRLKLVDDVPIRGRVSDTEGRHFAGAQVTITTVACSSTGTLDAFLTAWKRDSRDARGKLDRRSLTRLLPFLTTTTDRDGRFELSGIGSERVASVNVAANGYSSEEIQVVTRDGFKPDEYNQSAAANALPMMRQSARLPRLTAPVFDVVLEAELLIRGTVFTEPGRKPVVGANVSSGAPGQFARTDDSGHFELRGVRRSENAALVVGAPGGKLLMRLVRLDLKPGQTVVEADVEMKEGIVVEGRVFDQETGRGVRSNVRFAPLPGNNHFDQPGYDASKNLRQDGRTDDDGHFRLLVIPGPGLLIAQVQGPGPQAGVKALKPYRQATLSGEEIKRVPVTVDRDDRHVTTADNALVFLSSENAVKVIDLMPDSQGASFELPLDPGKTVNIAIEDEQGQPVSDAFVSGLADSWPYTFRIAEPTHAIYGLGADRPRRVCILHAERKLAATITLTGDEQGPVVVRLAASALIAGRVLNAGGEPVADAKVQINYARRSASEMKRFVNLELPPLTTDGDGRFHVENVLPGETFQLDFRLGDSYFRAPLTDGQRSLKAGQKLELGDMRAKQLR